MRKGFVVQRRVALGSGLKLGEMVVLGDCPEDIGPEEKSKFLTVVRDTGHMEHGRGVLMDMKDGILAERLPPDTMVSVVGFVPISLGKNRRIH